MNILTTHNQHGMPYQEGVWHIMSKISKGIVKAGFELYDVFVYHPGIKRTVRLTHDRRGERIRSETKACEVRYEALTRITNHTFDPADYRKERPHSFDRAIISWWDRCKDRFSPKSRKDYDSRIKHILIPHFADLDIRDINGKAIKDFRFAIEQSRGPKTVNNIMAILKTFFNDVYENQVIKQMPFFPGALKVDYKYRQWCTLEVLLTITSAIKDDMIREAILTARYQLLRVGEVRGLLWEDILFDEDKMLVRNSFSNNVFRDTTKTGTFIIKPMHSAVKDMLLKRRGMARAFVFTYRGRPLSESILRKRFNAARDEKGFAASLTLSGATRHSGATEGYIRTKNIHAVQKALGHSDIRTTMKYTHTDESEARIIIEPKGKTVDINDIRK